MILVLAAADDPHYRAVAAVLERRGARVFLWQHADFPAAAEISLRFGARGPAGHRLRRGAEELDFAEVKAVWLRRLPHAEKTAENAAAQGEEAARYLQGEATAFLQAAFRQLACPWVPGAPDGLFDAQDKASQLAFAARLGFELPPTLISNSPADFLAFYREHGGKVVSKAFHLPVLERGGDAGRWFLHTRMVSHRRVGYASTIRRCPGIFQAYVPKALELRVTVVGDRVFACAIHSQHTHHTRHDWRRYDLAHTPHLEHALPPEVRERCLALVRGYRLCYGAIDLVLTPDGRHVFLELNPTGQYLWIEKMTGMPISEAIADLLLRAAAGEAAAGVAAEGSR